MSAEPQVYIFPADIARSTSDGILLFASPTRNSGTNFYPASLKCVRQDSMYLGKHFTPGFVFLLILSLLLPPLSSVKIIFFSH